MLLGFLGVGIIELIIIAVVVVGGGVVLAAVLFSSASNKASHGSDAMAAMEEENLRLRAENKKLRDGDNKPK